jgi:signal transduction histidine kinase
MYCLQKSTSLLSILLETCSCILEFTKPVQSPIKYTEFNFRELCDDLKELFKSDLLEKKLQLEIEYLYNTWVRSEPTRLRQILINLVSNGIKYTPYGGKIELKVSKCCDS